MTKLKRLSCSINLHHICGQSFEKDTVETLRELFQQFKDTHASNYIQYFHYPQTYDQKKLDKFKTKFKGYEEFVKFVPEHEFNVRTMWFVIITEEELDKNKNMSNRAFYVLKKVTKNSVSHALINFYVKASLLTQISISGIGKK